MYSIYIYFSQIASASQLSHQASLSLSQAQLSVNVEYVKTCIERMREYEHAAYIARIGRPHNIMYLMNWAIENGGINKANV